MLLYQWPTITFLLICCVVLHEQNFVINSTVQMGRDPLMASMAHAWKHRTFNRKRRVEEERTSNF